jgi:hypothetical protein
MGLGEDAELGEPSLAEWAWAWEWVVALEWL